VTWPLRPGATVRVPGASRIRKGGRLINQPPPLLSALYHV